MSSIWLIGLGLAAGYLMQQKRQIVGKLDAAAKEFNQAASAADPGPQTDEIRAVQRTVPDADVNDSMNMQDLTRSDAQRIRMERDRAAMEVVQYETATAPPPIEGVYLHFDNHGV